MWPLAVCDRRPRATPPKDTTLRTGILQPIRPIMSLIVAFRSLDRNGCPTPAASSAKDSTNFERSLSGEDTPRTAQAEHSLPSATRTTHPRSLRRVSGGIVAIRRAVAQPERFCCARPPIVVGEQ